MRLGVRFDYGITIGQNVISLIVLEAIASFFGFGTIREGVRNVYNYRINSLKNINSFISVFNEAKLQGAKSLDYADFSKGIELINNKQHLTRSGLNSLKAISSNMNSKRTKFE
jgi:LAGLIDADG endonuclease